MNRQFAVIGLGTFGKAVACELMGLGQRVLGVDSREEKARRLADSLTQVVIANTSDEEALGELNLPNFDAVLVAVDESIEANILCTLAVKTLGSKEVWVQVSGPAHKRIVESLGADRILFPEYEMGLQAARNIVAGETL